MSEQNYRQYLPDTSVAFQYKKMRENQTLEYAKRMKSENLYRMHNGGVKFDVMDAINKLNDFIDNSDPDITLSNIHHSYQTAEAIRKDGYPEWLQVVGLIHDLGKIMFLWGTDNNGTSCTTQWGVVGDTYILGCALRNNEVYPEYDKLCPDMNDSNYNTHMGIYSAKCGLDNCVYTWGHDEYMYDVLQYNKQLGYISSDFPDVAYAIIRYHSLYPWHKHNEYSDFENDNDVEIKKYVNIFNKYDLYTKENTAVDISSIKEYYQNLLNKYFTHPFVF